MKNKNKRRIIVFLSLFLLLSISFVTVCSAADRQTIDFSEVGISYTNQGATSLHNVSQDENMVGDKGQSIVTLEFYLFFNNDHFRGYVEDYNSGFLIDQRDLLRIGYPDDLDYKNLYIEYVDEFYFDRYQSLNGVYNYNLYDYSGNSYDYNGDRDLSYDRYFVSVQYMQNASLPAYSSNEYVTNGSYWFEAATVGSYVYNGSSDPYSNFFIWSPILDDYDRLGEYLIVPLRVSCTFGTPKSVSWSTNTNPMYFYTICTYFDIFNGWLNDIYPDDIVSKSTQTVTLANDYYLYQDAEEFIYPGGMGWNSPYSAYAAAPPIGGFTDEWKIDYLEVNKYEFSAGREVEYYPISVDFYRATEMPYKNGFYFVISGGYMNDYSLYLAEYNAYKNNSYGIDDPYNPLALMHPYAGCWYSLDQTDNVSLSYDGAQLEDMDVSDLYQKITFDMPTFSDDLPLWENLAHFFKGFLMAIISLATSLANNVIVWLMCESPLISRFTKPVYFIFKGVLDIFKEYTLPLFKALGVFAPILALAIIVGVIKRNK